MPQILNTQPWINLKCHVLIQGLLGDEEQLWLGQVMGWYGNSEETIDDLEHEMLEKEEGEDEPAVLSHKCLVMLWLSIDQIIEYSFTLKAFVKYGEHSFLL